MHESKAASVAATDQHDVLASLATGKGFCDELSIVHEQLLRLVGLLPTDIDPELRQAFEAQVASEMPHCLNRVVESLISLEALLCQECNKESQIQ